ncbi:MAG: tripartite tricarboxylate transporter substrate binding protein, partial [Clostridia bacterium]
MTFIHRRSLLAATAAAALSLCTLAQAQGGLGSGAPVRLIVGYSAGGPVDQGARLFSIALSKELGTTVMVDNKTGANATLAGN